MSQSTSKWAVLCKGKFGQYFREEELHLALQISLEGLSLFWQKRGEAGLL